MKLFLWRAPSLLTEYTAGVAFALADTLDQALDLAADAEEPRSSAGWVQFRKALSECQVEVIDKPFGFTLRGGGC